MTPDDLKLLTIRTGLLLKRDFGYLLACDPATEEDSPHARIVVLHAGRWTESWVKFNAHSMCGISRPATGVVAVSAEGFFAVFSRSVRTGNIFQPGKLHEKRYGSIRSVAEIEGRAWVVGLRGSVYFLDDNGEWKWAARDLPDDVNLEAIAGVSGGLMYAVGFKGAIWRFDGHVWALENSPTNVNLTCVASAPEGVVYAAGHRGMFLRRRSGVWEVVDQENVGEDIWDLQWFNDTLFASSLSAVYRLSGDTLAPVSFGTDEPRTSYQLTATDGLLWSVGEGDVMEFDGTAWKRVV